MLSQRGVDARKHLLPLILGSNKSKEEKALKQHSKVCKECSTVFAELNEVGSGLRAVILPLVVDGTTALGFPAAGQ